jgi:hypothetical protein
MIVFFGTAHKKLATFPLAVPCTHCNTMDSLTMDIYQKYGHVFWIPFVPSGHTAITRCSNCGMEEFEKYFPADYTSAFFRLKSTLRKPWWTYSGLGLLILSIVITIIVSEQDKAYDAQIILTPKKGDVYEVKLNDSEYTLYKVDRVHGGVVFIFENEYTVDQSTGLYKLEDKPYSKESTPVSLTSLKHMLEVGEIINVERQ